MNYRVYYNRHSDFPLIWSVDEGDQSTEKNFKKVEFHKVVAETGIDESVPNGDKERPRVFFVVRYANLVVTNNEAHLFHDSNWRVPPIEIKF